MKKVLTFQPVGLKSILRWLVGWIQERALIIRGLGGKNLQIQPGSGMEIGWAATSQIKVIV